MVNSDLSNFTRNVKSIEDMKRMADDGEKILERFVRAHIEHNKPLVSLVNGPAIGFVVLCTFNLMFRFRNCRDNPFLI
jgi:enoyl-CoA hydratase/carnithine racemase